MHLLSSTGSVLPIAIADLLFPASIGPNSNSPVHYHFSFITLSTMSWSPHFKSSQKYTLIADKRRKVWTYLSSIYQAICPAHYHIFKFKQWLYFDSSKDVLISDFLVISYFDFWQEKENLNLPFISRWARRRALHRKKTVTFYVYDKYLMSCLGWK